ncbi:hypothetical protein QBB31_44320 [Streptomyces scabiei]|uniref:hypothetical protein n=1 Tax=Streptomyces scabiei TaxID=1930 RepID=UPI002FF3249C
MPTTWSTPRICSGWLSIQPTRSRPKIIAQPYAPSYFSWWILSRRAPEYTATASTREKPRWATGSAHSRLAHGLPDRVVWEQTGQWLSATGWRVRPAQSEHRRAVPVTA